MIQYRIATLEDIEQIARVHIACFPNTMWEFLGMELVRNFYEEYIREDNLFIVATNKDAIIGFVMGYKIPSHARTLFMQKNRIRLMKRITLGLLTCNRMVIQKCVDYLKPQKQIPTITAEGDLLSICVTDEFKGKGVAQHLVEEFEKELKKRAIHDYTLSVYSSNHRALAFYQRQGLHIVANTMYTQILYKHL